MIYQVVNANEKIDFKTQAEAIAYLTANAIVGVVPLELPDPPPEIYTGPSVTIISIRKRREFAEDLLERFKEKNINEGLNALQAMWTHHRMRALSITFYGLPTTLDILNLVVSGDIEIACLAFQNCVPDDMSQPFHWLNQTRVNWVIAEMKRFLKWP